MLETIYRKFYLAYILYEKLYIVRRLYSQYRAILRKLKFFYTRIFVRKIGKEQIKNDLRRIGLKEGDVVLVHSTLSNIGYVHGGADTVIDALLETVGSTGTVIMPTLTFDARDFMQSNPPVFDPRETPCYTGKIPETFRQRRNAVRSLHPTHSVAAIGPHAEYLTKDNEKSQTPCGEHSPFYKLMELDGYLLVLGSPFTNMPSFHIIEDKVSHFSVEVYFKEPIKVRYVDNSGVEKTMMLKLHDPNVARRRLEKSKGKGQEIFDYCVKRGIIKSAYIGKAKSYLLKARDLEMALEELLSQGITIYLPEE